MWVAAMEAPSAVAAAMVVVWVPPLEAPSAAATVAMAMWVAGLAAPLAAATVAMCGLLHLWLLLHPPAGGRSWNAANRTSTRLSAVHVWSISTCDPPNVARLNTDSWWLSKVSLVTLPRKTLISLPTASIGCAMARRSIFNASKSADLRNTTLAYVLALLHDNSPHFVLSCNDQSTHPHVFWM